MTSNNTALVLSGGGARAAYQVGILKAIAEILPQTTHKNPFPIVTGTSAGAINATVVAAYAQHFKLGMRRLENVWANFHCHQVFHTSFKELNKNTWRWIKLIFGNHPHQAIGLLDNEPLKHLLNSVIPYPLINKALQQGALKALCVTASSYSCGESISFYQSKPDILPWQRHHRHGQASIITTQHLLASAAIPMVFPSVQLGNKYFGDGSMRFLSPLSPAVQLGADRLLVVGVDPVESTPTTTDPESSSESANHGQLSPTLAEIGGHLLDSIFIDSLDSDLERLQRINDSLAKIPDKIRDKSFKLRPINTLVINPSEDISQIARHHFDILPRYLKFFLRRIGIDGDSGDTVLSYLLFEKPFTKQLINLGYRDALRMREQIIDFHL
ncbi:MAG: patatin-like phospholipase family protein [Kangiellaceae bacterium]|jgi:NTE family protein|nr:patatin-like phospholipase family protein [Kangiellaceae bacterium]